MYKCNTSYNQAKFGSVNDDDRKLRWEIQGQIDIINVINENALWYLFDNILTVSRLTIKCHYCIFKNNKQWFISIGSIWNH